MSYWLLPLGFQRCSLSNSRTAPCAIHAISRNGNEMPSSNILDPFSFSWRGRGRTREQEQLQWKTEEIPSSITEIRIYGLHSSYTHTCTHTYILTPNYRIQRKRKRMYTTIRLISIKKNRNSQPEPSPPTSLCNASNKPLPPSPLLTHSCKDIHTLQQQRSGCSSQRHNTHHTPAHFASRTRERRNGRAGHTRRARARRTASRRCDDTARGTVACRERRRCAASAHAAGKRGSLDRRIATGSCAGPGSRRRRAGRVSGLLRVHGYGNEGLSDRRWW